MLQMLFIDTMTIEISPHVFRKLTSLTNLVNKYSVSQGGSIVL